MTAPRKHLTGWEDGGMATLVRCGTTRIDKDIILRAGPPEEWDEPQVCPVCGATLRLVWDVRIETEDA